MATEEFLNGECIKFSKIRMISMESRAGLHSALSHSPMLSADEQEYLNRKLIAKMNTYMVCQPAKLTLKGFRRQNNSNSHRGSHVGIVLKKSQQLKKVPQFNGLAGVIEKRKEIYRFYRNQIDQNFPEILTFYIKLLQSSIKTELVLHRLNISKQTTLPQTLNLISNSLFEIGMQKLSLFFCLKGIQFGQIFKTDVQIGQMLFLCGRIARKINRVDESLVLCKKSLEYLWRGRILGNTIGKEVEVEVYGEISKVLMQMDRSYESKIFQHKHHSGYSQPKNSRIIQLSYELLKTAQSLKEKPTLLSKQTVEFILGFEIDELAKSEDSHQEFSMNLSSNFEKLYEGMFSWSIFGYEIPLPTDLSERGLIMVAAKPVYSNRLRSYSLSNMRIAKQVLPQKYPPKESLIFRYRHKGGFSKLSLLRLFGDWINFIESKISDRNEEKKSLRGRRASLQLWI